MRTPSPLAAGLLLVFAAAGCDDDPPPGPDIGRVLTLGDNVASNPSYATGYVALLAQNDDGLFPAFAGKDLARWAPAAELVRLDRGGDSYAALASNPETLCTCVPPDCPETACIDQTDERPTTVIVELGVNDLFGVVLQLLSDADLRADPSAAVERFRGHVRAVLERVAGEGLLARPPTLLVANVYDPTDGTGDVDAVTRVLISQPDIALITPERVLGLIADYNRVIAEETAAVGGTLIDLHGHFLGHGLFHDDAASPAYVADDATRWFSGAIDPNRRGAHEIRRLLWTALTGERIDAVPTDLPPDSTIGFPGVPEIGWTNAAVEVAVSPSIMHPDLGELPNLGQDPEWVLGPPGGGPTQVLALGTVGAYVVLDLGEGEAACDGEGPDLLVLEYGIMSGGVPEPYRVAVGDTPEGPWTTLGDGTGEEVFDLADAGVDCARYVRVESLAQLVDILGGLGSPYFPGPELDAVGAVYPGGAP